MSVPDKVAGHETGSSMYTSRQRTLSINTKRDRKGTQKPSRGFFFIEYWERKLGVLKDLR